MRLSSSPHWQERTLMLLVGPNHVYFPMVPKSDWGAVEVVRYEMLEQSLVTWCDMSSQYITVVKVPGAALGWKHGEWFFVPWVRPHQFRPWRLLTRSMLSEFCRGVLSVVSLLSDSQYEYGWRKRYHLQNKWWAWWSTIQLGLSCTLSGVRQLGCWNRAA